MAWILKDGSGTLFKNEKRESENSPDYRGEIMLGGVVYRIAGWIKKGQRGSFLSLSGQPKDEQTERRPKQEQKPLGGIAEMEDDQIPFR